MKRVVFMGTPDFAVPILQALIEEAIDVVLVVTQPDRPVGRKQRLTPPPVKRFAQKHEIPVFQPERIKEDYETILEYSPDLIITAAYGQILPKALLDAPPLGSINVHASLLPELRGGAPIHYAILEGKKETGITIMYMEEKLDAGDMIAQAKLPIERTDHVGILHDKLADLGATLLIETLPAIFSKTNERIPQDEKKATFAPNITRELEKIDWNRRAEEVYNHIRGLHPWPVAYTKLEGERIKVWWGEPTDVRYEGEPGEVVAIDEESITVVCGDQKGLRLLEIQPAGKKRMKVSEFLRGHSNKIQKAQRFQS